jgi:hypothetical protein
MRAYVRSNSSVGPHTRFSWFPTHQPLEKGVEGTELFSVAKPVDRNLEIVIFSGDWPQAFPYVAVDLGRRQHVTSVGATMQEDNKPVETLST